MLSCWAKGEAALAEIATRWRDRPGETLRDIPGLVPCRGGRVASHQRGVRTSAAWTSCHCPHGRLSMPTLTGRRGRRNTAIFPGTWPRRAAAPMPATGVQSRSSAEATNSALPVRLRRNCTSWKERIAPDHIWFADDDLRSLDCGMSDRGVSRLKLARLNAATLFTMQSRVNLMRPDAVTGAVPRRVLVEAWLGVDRDRKKSSTRWKSGSSVEETIQATRNPQIRRVSASVGSFNSAIPARRGRIWRSRASCWLRSSPTTSVSLSHTRCRARALHTLVEAAQLGERA